MLNGNVRTKFTDLPGFCSLLLLLSIIPFVYNTTKKRNLLRGCNLFYWCEMHKKKQNYCTLNTVRHYFCIMDAEHFFIELHKSLIILEMNSSVNIGMTKSLWNNFTISLSYCFMCQFYKFATSMLEIRMIINSFLNFSLLINQIYSPYYLKLNKLLSEITSWNHLERLFPS